MSFVIYKLLDRKENPDSFFQNSDGTRDTEKKMNFTNSRGLVNPFWAVDKKTGGRVQYQYIEGCPFYDVARQKLEGYIANANNSIVAFAKGVDIIVDEDKMKPLIGWLDIYPGNTKSQYHDANVHEAVFERFDPKEITKKEIAEANAEDEAMDIYRALTKTPERMRSVAMLFDETKGLSDDEEIQVGLRSVAKLKPIVFTSSIANTENKVLSDVLMAKKYGVIGKDAKGYFYEGENGAKLFETAAKEKNADKELVDYLMTKEGDIQYRGLLIKIAQKEVEMNAPTT